MLTIIPITTEGAPPEFCLIVPAGAKVRGATAKQFPGVLANSVKTFFGIFFEGDDDEDHPQEFRFFGWVPVGAPIGGELNHEYIYRAQVFCPDGLFFLYEYPKVGATQVEKDLLIQQRRMQIESLKRESSNLITI